MEDIRCSSTLGIGALLEGNKDVSQSVQPVNLVCLVSIDNFAHAEIYESFR